MGYRRIDDNVLGETTRGRFKHCRKCFDKCEDALEFVEAVKDLLEEFYKDDKCCCPKKCHCDHDND